MGIETIMSTVRKDVKRREREQALSKTRKYEFAVAFEKRSRSWQEFCDQELVIQTAKDQAKAVMKHRHAMKGHSLVFRQKSVDSTIIFEDKGLSWKEYSAFHKLNPIKTAYQLSKQAFAITTIAIKGNPADSKKLMTVNDAMRVLQLPSEAIQMIIKEGRLSAVNVVGYPGTWLIAAEINKLAGIPIDDKPAV
jgi:hypothetical protein